MATKTQKQVISWPLAPAPESQDHCQCAVYFSND